MSTFDEKDPQWKRDEYTEAMQTSRHYSALRFAILSVFVGINGALFVAGFPKIVADASLLCRVFFGVAGALLLIAFITYEWQLNDFIHWVRKRAMEHQEAIPFRLLGPRRVRRFGPVSLASCCVYGSIAILWIITLAVSSSPGAAESSNHDPLSKNEQVDVDDPGGGVPGGPGGPAAPPAPLTEKGRLGFPGLPGWSVLVGLAAGLVALVVGTVMLRRHPRSAGWRTVALTGASLTGLSLSLISVKLLTVEFRFERAPPIESAVRWEEAGAVRPFDTASDEIGAALQREIDTTNARLANPDCRPALVAIIGSADKRLLKPGVQKVYGDNWALARARAEAVRAKLKIPQSATTVVLVTGPEHTRLATEGNLWEDRSVLVHTLCQ